MLPLLVAAASRLVGSRTRAEALRGVAVSSGAGALRASCSRTRTRCCRSDEFWSDVQQAGGGGLRVRQARPRLRLGVLYYLWVLTWGLRVGAARGGARRARWSRFREDLRRALFLVPWPLVFIVYMGTQERFFGRWLLPALPALAILAGARRGARCSTRSRRGGRACSRVAAAVVAVALAPGPLLQRARRPRALARRHAQPGARLDGRATCRRARRSWSSRSSRTRGSRTPTRRTPRKRAARGLTRSGRRWIKFPTGRTTVDEQGRQRRGGKGRFVSVEDYERTLRPALIDSYERGGYCWVVAGSTQYGRASRDPGEVPRAIALLPGARRGAADVVYRVIALPRRARARSSSTSTGASTTTRAPTSGPGPSVIDVPPAGRPLRAARGAHAPRPERPVRLQIRRIGCR